MVRDPSPKKGWLNQARYGWRRAREVTEATQRSLIIEERRRIVAEHRAAFDAEIDRLRREERS